SRTGLSAIIAASLASCASFACAIGSGWVISTALCGATPLVVIFMSCAGVTAVSFSIGSLSTAGMPSIVGFFDLFTVDGVGGGLVGDGLRAGVGSGAAALSASASAAPLADGFAGSLPASGGGFVGVLARSGGTVGVFVRSGG